MVMWIIGLSGAGKTTLSNAILEKVRLSKNNIVLIDGDLVREAFGNDLGHSMHDRKKMHIEYLECANFWMLRV